MQDLEVHVVACTQQPMPSPPKLASNISFHLLHVPKIGWMRTGYQGCVRAVRTKLRQIGPDLVHGEGTERECALAAAFSGFPNLVTIHGNMREVAKAMNSRPASFLWFAARLESLALARTDGVLCNSAYTEAVVRSRASRTWRVANALRREFFDAPLPAAQFPSGNRKPLLLNVGSVDCRKRQLVALKVARQLHDAGYRFELLFVGPSNPDDAYAGRFLAEVADAEREGFARYVGVQTLSDLINLMDQSEALIHIPSEEAFGLVVAEALARNLKFFGSDIGGIPDIARGVEEAELFAPEDETGLKSAVARWLSASCPRPQTAALTILERYHPDVIARRHAEIYQELLDAR